jgi:hypothetical protein
MYETDKFHVYACNTDLRMTGYAPVSETDGHVIYIIISRQILTCMRRNKNYALLVGISTEIGE